ncbi:Spindle assembly checkpoint kinase (Aurora kinase) (Increase-in-ploidy protein 1), partial [Durusdinium trenchii]
RVVRIWPSLRALLQASWMSICHCFVYGALTLHQSLYKEATKDVSLENMLIFLDDEEQWQVRVGDPGQAVAFVMDPATGQEKVVSFNGLVADDFRPPELYEEKDYLASRVDSWCLGWNTFYLLTAAPLFKTSDPAMQDTDFLLLSQGRISQLFEMKGVSHRLSYDAKDFVTQLMHRDPVKRMPIKDALWHPWLKDCLAQQLRGESTSKLRMPLVPEASSSTEPVFDTAPVPVSTLDSGASSSSANISPALTEHDLMYSSLAEEPQKLPSRTGGPFSGRIDDLRAADTSGTSLLQAAASWSLERLPTLLSSLQSDTTRKPR